MMQHRRYINDGLAATKKNSKRVSVMLLLFLVSLCAAQPWNLPLATFPAGSPWTEDVSNAPLDPNSASIIARLGSFGTNPIRFDVSFQPLYSNCATPRVPFVKAAAYSTECTTPPPAFIPLPNVGGEICVSSIFHCRQLMNCGLRAARNFFFFFFFSTFCPFRPFV